MLFFAFFFFLLFLPSRVRELTSRSAGAEAENSFERAENLLP